MNKATGNKTKVKRLLQRIVSRLFGFKPITEARLDAAGFVYKTIGNNTPYEIWEKHGIVVWNFNGKYWIVDLLDQAYINKEFKLMPELELFFIGCGLDMYS